MTVITFKSTETNTPIANIIHIGAHPTAAGNNKEITRDWPGVMADRLAEESGAITMFVNGTQGDVAPRIANGGSDGKLKHAMEVGGLAGIDAVRAYKSIRTFYDEDLQVICGQLTLPYKPPLSKEYIQAFLETYTPTDWWSHYKHSSVKRLAEMYAEGNLGPEEWTARQIIIRLGPIVFVPYPFEVSSEIGLRLRAYSPYQHTLLLACTNGCNSYLPAQSQISRGGYEIQAFWWFRPRQLPDDADTRLINQNLNLIEEINSGRAI